MYCLIVLDKTSNPVLMYLVTHRYAPLAKYSKLCSPVLGNLSLDHRFAICSLQDFFGSSCIQVEVSICNDSPLIKGMSSGVRESSF